MASDFKQCLPVIPNGSRADTRIIFPRDSRARADYQIYPTKNHLLVITLKSVDSALSNSEGARYPVEFLNTLDPGCLPPHKLNIKTGVPLILIRTINPPILTNETRQPPNIIEAEITTEGPYQGQRVFIPRIPLTNSDGRGVPFKRVQFPAKVAFAITINRSQGQTFDHLGCDFVKPPFTHGQLYVAVTRVRNPHNLSLGFACLSQKC